MNTTPNPYGQHVYRMIEATNTNAAAGITLLQDILSRLNALQQELAELKGKATK